jgi:hypothetical protein
MHPKAARFYFLKSAEKSIPRLQRGGAVSLVRFVNKAIFDKGKLIQEYFVLRNSDGEILRPQPDFA